MYAQIVFWLLFIILWCVIIILDRTRGILRDISCEAERPFSFARVQLAWWTVIILSSFISIIIVNKYHVVPTFDKSALILLGISLATTTAAAAIDTSDRSNQNSNPANNPPNPPIPPDLNQDIKSDKRGLLGFFEDIMSDQNGITISRFQTVIFHITFGCIFIHHVIAYINAQPLVNINAVMPQIEDNNLILLGLSTGTYAVLKTTENK